ncbi:MAG: hypothetical protein E6G06_21270, partial [Actinobacteria bacterium]
MRGRPAARPRSGDGRLPRRPHARGRARGRHLHHRHRRPRRPAPRALRGDEGRRHPRQLRPLQRRDRSRGAGQDRDGATAGPPVRGGVHGGRAPAPLRPGRGTVDQPRVRRGTPGGGHGHELRQSGARRRVHGQARAEPRAQGLRGADRHRSRDRTPQARLDGRRHRRAVARAGVVPRVLEARNLIPPRVQRSQAILVLVLGLVVLGFVGEIVPLYTDWLWFQEVGYTDVFLTTLGFRGSLFTVVAVVVLAFLYGNLTFAAHRARPDVLWELEDQLGLPGRVVIEPIIRRFLPFVLAFIAFTAGLRASARWETVLQYRNAVPFGTTDPLFNRDLGFFVFALPFWRMALSWATTLVIGTLVLTVVIYVLQRSLVLTARGPRLAAGARTHILLLGAVFLTLTAVGFWLERFELLYSPRGVVFGASYTDIHASLPVLGALAVLAGLCAIACFVQIIRGGLRLIAAGLLVLVGVWIVGLGIYPALLQRFRVTPNELAAERPFIQHNIRMTRQAYGLDRIEEKEFPADESLDAR